MSVKCVSKFVAKEKRKIAFVWIALQISHDSYRMNIFIFWSGFFQIPIGCFVSSQAP